MGAAAGRSIPALYATCYLVARYVSGLGCAADYDFYGFSALNIL